MGVAFRRTESSEKSPKIEIQLFIDITVNTYTGKK